jgi:hypothetical protein
MGKYKYWTVLSLIILLKPSNFVDLNRIISNIYWGKYKYGTILQLITQLIYFKVSRYIYGIINNITLGKY